MNASTKIKSERILTQTKRKRKWKNDGKWKEIKIARRKKNDER